MDEINSRPRYFWCSKDQAQFVLDLIVHVDGKIVGQFRVPLAKTERKDIPDDDPQKIAKYKFVLNKHGHRKFRGVSSGAVEGNFWVGLTTDSEIWLGHSWVSKNKVILHEMLTFEVGKPTILEGSGIKIEAKWVKP